MCEKLHIWINYGGVFPSNLPILQFGYCFFYPNYLCVNNEDINCINSSPKMSFLMLLQISLKFWQMCKNFPAIISGKPQFFIRRVNYAWGRWNRPRWLTMRLTGRQAWCEWVLLSVTSPQCPLRDEGDGWRALGGGWGGQPRPLRHQGQGPQPGQALLSDVWS